MPPTVPEIEGGRVKSVIVAVVVVVVVVVVDDIVGVVVGVVVAVGDVGLRFCFVHYVLLLSNAAPSTDLRIYSLDVCLAL